MQRNVLHPTYYSKNNHDLWWYYSQGLLSAEELKGFIKGNIIKYITRYQGKNGIEDLKKAETYLQELIRLEQDNRTM